MLTGECVSAILQMTYSVNNSHKFICWHLALRRPTIIVHSTIGFMIQLSNSNRSSWLRWFRIRTKVHGYDGLDHGPGSKCMLRWYSALAVRVSRLFGPCGLRIIHVRRRLPWQHMLPHSSEGCTAPAEVTRQSIQHTCGGVSKGCYHGYATTRITSTTFVKKNIVMYSPYLSVP